MTAPVTFPSETTMEEVTNWMVLQGVELPENGVLGIGVEGDSMNIYATAVNGNITTEYQLKYNEETSAHEWVVVGKQSEILAPDVAPPIQHPPTEDFQLAENAPEKWEDEPQDVDGELTEEVIEAMQLTKEEVAAMNPSDEPVDPDNLPDNAPVPPTPSEEELALQAQENFFNWLREEGIPKPPGGIYEDIEHYQGDGVLRASVTSGNWLGFGEEKTEFYYLPLDSDVRDWLPVIPEVEQAEPEVVKDEDDSDDPPMSPRVKVANS